ncbi:MAG TPA: DUF2339 domain-containing protein [Verrucomicrobiae bacterium]|nr:DUF2339 domain-containing protein [Verrucomicrobiae bacterium]
MLELILVVFGIFAVATPFITIYLLWQQHKLRQRLLKLTDLSVEVSDGLRRDLLELKRQVEASAKAAAPVTEIPPVHHGVHTEVDKAPAPVPATPLPPKPDRPLEKPAPPIPASVAMREPKPVSPPVAAPVVTHPVVIPPVVVPPTVAPPVAAATPESGPLASVPSKPAGPEPVRPAAATPPPLSRREMPPAAPPSSPLPHPPTATPAPPTRVAAPPAYAAFRAAAPTSPAPPSSSAPAPSATHKTSEQRMKSVFAFEELLGRNWFVKIGITLIVLGVALWGISKLGQLGPLGKVALSYMVSLALLGGGTFLEKRERYRLFSYPSIGGGWSLLFFTTYALNHVAAMRVLASFNIDLILMLAVALAMVLHTLRYRSQVVTGMAFLLGYWTVSLTNDGVYSLSAGVILAISLIIIVLKMGWYELEIFGILSGYANHIYWLYRLLGPDGAAGHTFREYHPSTTILLFYWITYRISYVIRRPKSSRDEHISTVAALLNTLLLLGALKFQSVRPDLAFMALLIIGAIEFTVGQLPLIRRRREAFVVLSVLGTALMVTSVPFRASNNNPVILWLIGAEVLLAAGVAVGEVVFRRLGLGIGLLVGLHLIGIDFQQLMVARRVNDDVVLAAGVIFGLCAAVFYLNALFVGYRWRKFFDDVPDAPLLNAHSYLGAFAAGSAAWALCSGDWTAVAFAAIMLTLAILGRQLKSFHLQLQYGVLGLLSLVRVVVVNLHSDIPQYTHVRERLITLPILAATFYLTAYFTSWSAVANDYSRRLFRGLFAFAGTALITALIYYEVPELWQAVAAIAFAVLLLEVGRQIGYPLLAWHAHLLAGLAALAALTADANGAQRWHEIPLHAFSALSVVAGAYWIAHRIKLPNAAHAAFARVVYSWAATGLMVWVLNEAVPAHWIAVSWIVFAVSLALVMRQIEYRQLGWQANAVAACSLMRAYRFDLEMAQPLWPGVSQRLITISIVAAGLYFLSRKSTPDSDSESRSAVAYLHTTAATALLALLAWHEAPTAWLATLWAIFALVLVLVDRRFELEDLRWQAHALAALAMARSVTVNLYVTDTWHGISVRLLSLAIVAVIFYALAQLIRMPEELRKREFHHIYSWAASALVSLLLWYELQALSIAVGWAVFGLVLFEYGLWRKIRQFRFQSYVALAASFGRIFFANLTAETPGEFWGPRIYTVLPITLILFFVYAQLGPQDASARDDRGLHFDSFIAYLGTSTVIALLYFQFANEWLVAAWAVVVFVLFGIARALDRPIFLHQALLLTLGACARGVMYNLFGASYFTGTDWTGRYLVLGSGIAVLLACLPFAFRWRARYKAQPSRNWMTAIARHPEQIMFFAPVLLLTLMLAQKMRAGMVTVAWGLEALAILIFAFAINERSFRLTGFLLLLASFAKMLLLDMWSSTWTWPDRYITFIVVGFAMFLASFLYTKYSDKIRQFL